MGPRSESNQFQHSWISHMLFGHSVYLYNFDFSHNIFCSIPLPNLAFYLYSLILRLKIRSYPHIFKTVRKRTFSIFNPPLQYKTSDQTSYCDLCQMKTQASDPFLLDFEDILQLKQLSNNQVNICYFGSV